MIKLHLAVSGKNERVEISAQPFRINVRNGLFSVTTPMGDDWLQTQDFDLRAASVLLEPSNSTWTLIFPDTSKLEHFRIWLADANIEAEKGYRTMYL